MLKTSAGLLMFRRHENNIEVLLGHPGGPLWAGRDEAAWSIFKGEYASGENPLDAAKREFEEETGTKPRGTFVKLTQLIQPSGKIVAAWAFEGDFDTTTLTSNTFMMEWPPQSGVNQFFPEVDRCEWFVLSTAKHKAFCGQVGFLEELEVLLFDSGIESLS